MSDQSIYLKLAGVVSAHVARHPLMLRWPSWPPATSHCGFAVAAWLAPASSRGEQRCRQHRTSERATDAESSRRLVQMEDEWESPDWKWTATETDRLVAGLKNKHVNAKHPRD